MLIAKRSGAAAENSHQPFRRREHAMLRFSKYEDAAEVQLSSRSGPQPPQARAPFHPRGLQAETLCRVDGAARSCG
jgi:hypothetical protein